MSTSNSSDGGRSNPPNEKRPPDSSAPQPAGHESSARETPASAPHPHAGEKDISSLLKGWDYEPGTINVRKIRGGDGKPKLQTRLELGLLQMELTGRPDGARPHGCESLLEYYEAQLSEHEQKHGTDLGFGLSQSQCQAIREEAQMYYQRYLALFVLEDFSAVVRDTGRNLRVLDFCGKYALDEGDRLILEQFRPYIVMMNARASASIALNAEKPREALRIVQETLETIREFFDSLGQPEAFGKSSEVRVLKRFARGIRKKLPVDPMQKLQTQLDRAVKSERYEEAARLRDEIRRKTGSPDLA